MKLAVFLLLCVGHTLLSASITAMPSNGRNAKNSLRLGHAGGLQRSTQVPSVSQVESRMSSFNGVKKHAKSPTASKQPTAEPVDEATQSEIDTMRNRRVSGIVGSIDPDQVKNVPDWMSTLGTDGSWPESEINYDSGCKARRANWPASDHWMRINTMAVAWRDPLKTCEDLFSNQQLLQAILLAMRFWFDHDFTEDACLGSGGSSVCPCSTPGLWDKNWFSNLILVPSLVGQACNLLNINQSLGDTDISNCSRILMRSSSTINKDTPGIGYLTGANALGVAEIALDAGLLTNDVVLVETAFAKAHDGLQISTHNGGDGILRDGSFNQHDGVLYNGNYGKDYANSILALEIAAAGTRFEADTDSKITFAALMDANRWMIYRNSQNGALHWDISVIGRFLTFPVADKQASAGILMNVSQIRELGQLWQSETIMKVANDLQSTDHTWQANVGNIFGNRMFFASDYMVHRGPGYVTTQKMYSMRTRNTECLNSQNPVGFHLSDGASYTHIRGNEYKDIEALWDWRLIPGTTIASLDSTPLECGKAGWKGKNAFVGGASDGAVGATAMRYENPITGLMWQQARLFLDDDTQHVMVSGIEKNDADSVYSVLDQRHTTSDIIVNGYILPGGGNFTNVTSLWHGDVGYIFEPKGAGNTLSVSAVNKTGQWSTIGTSTQPPITSSVFTAYIEHETALDYTILPARNYNDFQSSHRGSDLQTLQNDGHVSAVLDAAYSTLMVVFWDDTGGAIEFNISYGLSVQLSSDNAAIVLYRMASGNVIIVDPTQGLAIITITISLTSMTPANVIPPLWPSGQSSVILEFDLPQGSGAGSSISKSLANAISSPI